MAKKAKDKYGTPVEAEEEAKLPASVTSVKEYVCDDDICQCPMRFVRLKGAPYFAELSPDTPHHPDCVNNRHRPEGKKGGTVVQVATNDPEDIDVDAILEELEMPTNSSGGGGGAGGGGGGHGGGKPDPNNFGPRVVTTVKSKIKNALQFYVTVMALGIDILLHGGVLASDVIVNTDNYMDYLNNPEKLKGKKLLILGKCYRPIAMRLAETKPEGSIDWSFCLPFRCADEKMIYARVFFDSWATCETVMKKIKTANSKSYLVAVLAQWTYSEEADLRVVNALVTGEEQVRVLEPYNFLEHGERLRQPYRDTYAE